MIRTGVVILFLLATVCFSVYGQYKNFKIDEFASDQLINPSVAVNKRDAKNIVVTGTKDIIYITRDEGATWQKSAINSPFGITGDRALVSDGKGSLYSFHASDPGVAGTENPGISQIICHVSKDGGLTWDEGVGFGSVSGKDQLMPAATIDNKGNLFATWTQYDKFLDKDSLCQSLVMMSSSSNGKKWGKVLQVSQVAGNCKRDKNSLMAPIAAVGPDGKMFVSWYGAGKLHLDRSFSNGMWLENDIVIGTQSEGWELKVPGHAHATGLPELMIDQSKGNYHGCLYISWADQRNGETDTDVWFMRSNNHGDNWSSPMRMGNNSVGKHQYTPRMTVDQTNGNIYMVFYDRSDYDDEKTEVYLSYSTDSGAHFTTVKISESPFVPDDKSLFGTFLAISAHDGVITPIWSRMDNGSTSLWGTVIKQSDLIKPVSASKTKKKKK